jgi:mono/diheme cytochrome c family protein
MTRWAILAALPLCAQTPVSFHNQIRPILALQCAACHQPASRQADLLLTTYEGMKQGGRKGPTFIAGKPDESLVIQYLTGAVKPQMPFGGKPLPDDQIDLFRRWIREGARDDTPAGAAASPAERRPVVYHAPPMITAIAFAPSGRTVAVSGYHEILLVDREGKLEARLPGLSARIHSLAFTPDGATLVATGGEPAQFGEVQVWDVAARKLRHSIVVSADTLFGGSLSPDGKLLAAGAPDKAVRIFDVVEGKEIRRMDHHEDWVFGTVFGVDGRRLVSVGRDRAAKLSELATGRFVENVNLLREPLSAVARHPKRDWIVVGGQERVPYLYRMDRPRGMRIADDSTLIQKYDRQDGPILAVAVSPDGARVAVGSEVGDVRVYEAESGKLLARCRGHSGGIYAVEFTPDAAQLVTGGFDGTLRWYDRDGALVREFVPAPIQRSDVAVRQ